MENDRELNVGSAVYDSSGSYIGTVTNMHGDKITVRCGEIEYTITNMDVYLPWEIHQCDSGI